MYGYIYKTTNLLNNKIYIGQHKNNKFNKYYLGSGKYLVRAIKKYGKENFKLEIIEWCETKEQANTREKFWINTLQSNKAELGYNLSQGGDGGGRLNHVKINYGKSSKFVLISELQSYLDLGWVETAKETKRKNKAVARKRWKQAHPDRVKAAKKKWAKSHATNEKTKAYRKAWQQDPKNKEKLKAARDRYRAKLKNKN